MENELMGILLDCTVIYTVSVHILALITWWKSQTKFEFTCWFLLFAGFDAYLYMIAYPLF